MFRGRLNRTNFLLGMVYASVPIYVLIILYVIYNVIAIHENITVRSAVNVAFFGLSAVWILVLPFVTVSLSIRRWHDIGYSGWLTLLQYVPFIGVIAFLIQVFAPGTKGPNQYGFSQRSHNFKAILFGTDNMLPPPPPKDNSMPKPPKTPSAPGSFGSGSL